MNAVEVINKLRIFLHTKIEDVSKSNPLIGFVKPLILRAVDNNIHKLAGALGLMADSQGNIDIEVILPEMIQSVMNVDPFPMHINSFGDIIIGGGNIRIDIPFIDKEIVFSNSDFEDLRTLMTSN